MELCTARGVTKINQHPGCTSVLIDEEWTAKVNPHTEEHENVLPFHVWFFRSEFPVCTANAFGGSVVGPLETEDELIAALKAAITKETQ